MKTAILIYLLVKCARKRILTHLDSLVAFAIMQADPDGPEWLQMVANMELEAPLPEAFGQFRAELAAGIEARLARLDKRIGDWLA